MHAVAEQRAKPVSPRSTYRLAVIKGLMPAAAANLTAWLNGVPLHDIAKLEAEGVVVSLSPWTVRQVEQLLFLRWLRENGRVDG